ncbi:hypothetical protein ACFQ9X_48275 [Catenulispora yoronensis]
MPELTRWLTGVLRCVGVHRGFARVEVAAAGRHFEAVTVEIRSGGPAHGEDLCRVLGTGALATFADVVFDDRPAPVAANTGRAVFYAGDIAAPGVPPLASRAGARSSDLSGPSDGPACVAVLLASGLIAESTLLTAMASAAPQRDPHPGPRPGSRRGPRRGGPALVA